MKKEVPTPNRRARKCLPLDSGFRMSDPLPLVVLSRGINYA